MQEIRGSNAKMDRENVTEPLTEKDRFYFLKDKEHGKYSGVHMVFAWNIDDLPTNEQFLSMLVAKD